MKHITIVEGYESVLIGEGDEANTITREQAEELAAYIEHEQLKEQYIIWGSHSVLFINYVGFIQCSDFSIELLPKVAFEGEASCREVLYRMLNEVGYIQANISSKSYVSTTEDDLLELLAAYFATKLLKQLRYGIITQYVEVENNLMSLKGSLLVQKHIRENISRNKPYQAYCEYEERTEDHNLNRLFKTVSILLSKVVTRVETQIILQQILNLLDGISNRPITYFEAQSIIVDRTNKRYEVPLELAKLFLQRQVSTFSNDTSVSFSILFEMNDLFEKYIAQLMHDAIPDKVFEQHSGHRLLVNERTNRGIFQLRPDLVIENDSSQIVIDTKWKRLTNSGRHGVKREDLYQMYAYVTRYKNAKAAILLYPFTPEITSEAFPIEYWSIEEQENKKVAVHMVTLHSRSETITQLKEIVGYHLN
ncbi:McrC family protein [Sporosarcina sp. G11-34]|uniref:McrC family protein n=1 Tax=Sporosarcina sp. G11-34 TaxID=2849605 RepID=UPI0022A9894C|nr:hypothetical protein [Sporosarcina sp. G11-34]MCZ2260794.1 McrC family protein [Sporosarcina sp. G11-34]